MDGGTLAALLTAVGALVGVLVQWYRSKGEKDRGEDAADREHLSLTGQEYGELVDRLERTIIKPLERRVDDQETRIATLETELRTERSRVRAALTYIRTLLTWAATHAPAAIPPEPPEHIADDI